MKRFEDLEPEEEMSVELEFDSSTVICDVLTIFEAGGRDYIALHPRKNPFPEDGDIWFYRYSENPDDPNEEPVLGDIETDEEFEIVDEAYDEFVDTLEAQEAEMGDLE